MSKNPERIDVRIKNLLTSKMSISATIQKAVPNIPRRRRMLFGLAIQAILPAISLYIALLLRLDLNESRISYSAFAYWGLILIVLRVVALVYFKAHTGLWRYVSVPDLIGVIKATTAATIVFTVFGLIFANSLEIPRSIYLIEWGVHIFLAGGLRTAVRVSRERMKDAKDQLPKRRMIIIGAGDAGGSAAGGVGRRARAERAAAVRGGRGADGGRARRGGVRADGGLLRERGGRAVGRRRW